MLCFVAGAHLAEETRNARRAGNTDKRNMNELYKVRTKENRIRTT